MTRPFDAKAIPKCHDRLSKAKQALQHCRSARNFADFASHWSSFLIHTGSIINAVEAGSKQTPQGRQWHGGIKREGRKDPLLRYFFQARNAEEHALDPTTEHQQPGIGIGAGGESIYIKEFTPDQAFFQNPEKAIQGRIWRTADGKPPTIVHTPGGPQLLTVKDDRYGEAFPPPTEHMGKPLAKTDPVYVAERYIEYLEQLVQKASDLS
ncbi:hypothetical protein [Mesorhizobium sp. CAU 1732]|uniref:hypothetical protein n=1 Tax=Mesorhizobium sp. CAU 1732 TaxID=3140358 RepID=UPI00325FF707